MKQLYCSHHETIFAETAYFILVNVKNSALLTIVLALTFYFFIHYYFMMLVVLCRNSRVKVYVRHWINSWVRMRLQNFDGGCEMSCVRNVAPGVFCAVERENKKNRITTPDHSAERTLVETQTWSWIVTISGMVQSTETAFYDQFQ
ncbi:hypothetical protein KQX54_011552 [Cotesia glomerata]|uniref:Uncharacterized protein n=1 Tax=Cotesia glomerata TaxID=32391 RepID=A0AAV7J8J2_COTGL|nr:hypothetical protein KQX54_011552 [Cotesia glomerata]